MADLVKDFGLGPVKQEINPRPKPQDSGRPKVWDDLQLFSLWLIVQAWALRGNHEINTACRLLEEATGGLTMYTEAGDGVLGWGSCPRLWCKSGVDLALSGGFGRSFQAATADSVRTGSSLNGAMVSRVM
jgi:hypothetical protein